MSFNVTDKVVLVTGAGSGIGAEIARSFCHEKACTIFVDKDEDGLKQALDGYEDFGRMIPCDVSNKENVKRLFSTLSQEYGLLHILVNCAAVSVGGDVTDIEEAHIERIININIKGYIYTTMYAIPLMRNAEYGRLIYINSSSGLKASAGLSLYSASKYFNRGFAISVSLEVGKDNITSNSVCPSDVYPDGDMEAKSWRESSLLEVSLRKEGVASLEELIQQRRQRNPMRRSCTTEDIAHLVLFLASEQAGFINGQSIGINGGQLPF